MSRNHQTTTLTITAPELPAALLTQARAMAGELAVDMTTDREHIMQSCAEWCEGYVGRIFWSATGDVPRRSVAEITVTNWALPLDASPDFPNTSGVTVSINVVQRWDTATEAYADEAYKLHPASRLLIARAGLYRIEADLEPSVDPPNPVVDAVARLYAITSSRRPASTSLDLEGRVMNLDNLARRCGALDLLDSSRRNMVL